VWPHTEARDISGAVRDASLWYRRRRLPAIYQVTDTPRNAALNAVLDAQGYTRQSETLIMARSPGSGSGSTHRAPGSRTAQVPSADSRPAELSDQPTAEWLDLWWSVDGRGGAPELETARTILTGCPSLYSLVRSDDGAPAAVGRLALPSAGEGGYGGIYGMATRPGMRRQGLAGRVLHSLLEGAAEAGADELWLLVTAANTGAQALYEKAGFREAGRYAYRQERPLRARSGC
jgi:ribosomal protein S18 acetylase RimI-like enzyme